MVGSLSQFGDSWYGNGDFSFSGLLGDIFLDCMKRLEPCWQWIQMSTVKVKMEKTKAKILTNSKQFFKCCIKITLWSSFFNVLCVFMCIFLQLKINFLVFCSVLEDLWRCARSNHRRCSTKKAFLKISQISQEKTCVRVSF